MKLLNFNVGDDFISVVKDGSYLDLHNNFDFVGYNYAVANNEFQIIFNKASEDWASDVKVENLIFKFAGVLFLKIKGNDSTEDPDDEKCLSDIGFCAADLRNDMEFFLATNEFGDSYDLIFVFQTGQAIKIHSQEVLIEVF